jgi:hypothetical protein
MVVEALPIQERTDPTPSSGLAVQELIPGGEGSASGAQGEFLLGSLGDRRLRVVRPIHVVLRTEEGHFVAEAEELDEFGFGETRLESVRDLQRAIAGLYFALEGDKGRLGPVLASTLKRLREKVIPTLIP